MHRNLDFLVKSASVVGALLVLALMFFLVPKIAAIFGRKKIRLKHFAAVILWFLLQLKVILCTL